MFVLKRNYDDLLEVKNDLVNKLSECTIKCNQHFNDLIKIKKELDDTNDSYNSLNDKYGDLVDKYNDVLLDHKIRSSNSNDESKYYSDLLDLAFQDIDDKEELVQVLKNKINELNDILITYIT